MAKSKPPASVTISREVAEVLLRENWLPEWQSAEAAYSHALDALAAAMSPVRRR